MEVGDVGLDGRIQVEQAVVDELQDERRRPDLGDGADLEDRVGGGVDEGRRAEHAACCVDDLAVLEDGDDRAGNLVVADEARELRVDERLDLV